MIVADEADNARIAAIEELGGAVTVDIEARRERWPGWEGKLYDTAKRDLEATTARFVPYHLWDNRAPGEMLVWVRTQR